jgi:hypothetical protein
MRQCTDESSVGHVPKKPSARKKETILQTRIATVHVPVAHGKSSEMGFPHVCHKAINREPQQTRPTTTACVSHMLDRENNIQLIVDYWPFASQTQYCVEPSRAHSD